MEENTTRPKKKIGTKIITFLVVLIIVGTGIGLMAYPFIANWIFENRADSLVSSYEAEIEATDTSDLDEARALAVYYNEAIASGHVELRDPFTAESEVYSEDTYYDLLDLSGTGLMGYISIPCIDVELPIYHGTSTETLERGIGHLAGSSLPVGGESTHAVLTGHTGLSSAKLFTDLTELETGDIFILTVLGEKLAYEVDQILVVEPDDISELQVVDGEDYCTLVTCTPYGINSHRLLVRGVRTDYEEIEETIETIEVKTSTTSGSQWMSEYIKALTISITALIIALIMLFAFRALRRRSKRNKNDEKA